MKSTIFYKYQLNEDCTEMKIILRIKTIKKFNLLVWSTLTLKYYLIKLNLQNIYVMIDKY